MWCVTNYACKYNQQKIKHTSIHIHPLPTTKQRDFRYHKQIKKADRTDDQ